LCTHLKLCISQSADAPDDGPSSSTPGFISSEPSVCTPGPASLHRVECLDAAECVAAYDFIGLETNDKVVLGGTFLPEIWHTQDSTHTATAKLIEAVSAAQLEDTQYSVANPTFASPSFSTMECVSAPPSLAQDQSAQVELSAITSQDTAPLPPAGNKSAQVDSSAITSQDTAPLPPAGNKSAQVDSSAITSQDTAPLPLTGKECGQVESSAITSQDTAPLPPAGNKSAQVDSSANTSQDTAPLPPAGKESAQVDSSANTSQDTAPLPPAGKESAQVDSSATTSQDTAPLPPAGKESAQVDSSAITSQDIASLPPAGKESAQVDSSAITSQDTASLPPTGKESAQVNSSAITSRDTASLPPTDKESAQVNSSVIVHGPAAPSFAEKDITQGVLRSISEATMTSGRSTPLSRIEASSVVGLASQKNSGSISKSCLQKKVRASITSHFMPPNSTAHAETVHFIDFVDFMCAALSD